MVESLLECIDFESNKDAIIIPQIKKKISYKTLLEMTLDCGRKIKKISPRAKTIATILPNGIDAVVSFLSAIYFGFVIAPINPNLSISEIKALLKRIQPDIVLTRSLSDFTFIKFAMPINYESSDHLNVISTGIKGSELESTPREKVLKLFTSGTTSEPKEVTLSHEKIIHTTKNIVKDLRLCDTDITLLVMPLFHVHGLIGVLLSTFISKGAVVIPPKFSASSFWKDFSAFECSWFSAVPTIHQILYNTREIHYVKGLSSKEKATIDNNLRFIRSCSAPLAPYLFKKMVDQYKKPVIQAYAMTECAHQVCSNLLPPFTCKPGSVGLPDKGVDIIINNSTAAFEQGEILVKGKNVIKEYSSDSNSLLQCKNAIKFKNNYFYTGDIGYFDQDGCLYISGRKKEIINRGGEKISPYEVEDVLLGIKEVKEAACFPTKDKVYGEKVQAAVVLHSINTSDTKKTISPSEIISHCQTQLALFKCPKNVYILDSLPKNETGKLMRSTLSKKYNTDTYKYK